MLKDEMDGENVNEKAGGGGVGGSAAIFFWLMIGISKINKALYLYIFFWSGIDEVSPFFDMSAGFL
jgi:hypothetical protein